MANNEQPTTDNESENKVKEKFYQLNFSKLNFD